MGKLKSPVIKSISGIITMFCKYDENSSKNTFDETG
jgi:hypothetical protein